MKAEELLEEVQRTRFWGSVQLDFREGELVLIRKTETMKPSRENTRYAPPIQRQK